MKYYFKLFNALVYNCFAFHSIYIQANKKEICVDYLLLLLVGSFSRISMRKKKKNFFDTGTLKAYEKHTRLLMTYKISQNNHQNKNRSRTTSFKFILRIHHKISPTGSIKRESKTVKGRKIEFVYRVHATGSQIHPGSTEFRCFHYMAYLLAGHRHDLQC